MERPHFKKATTGLKKLYKSGHGSDVTVVCGDKKWPLHKAILSANGGYFESIIKDSFKEGKKSVIDFNTRDPELIDEVLQFVYGIISDTFTEDGGNKSAIFFVRLYEIADEFLLYNLKHNAVMIFTALVRESDIEFARACLEVRDIIPTEPDTGEDSAVEKELRDAWLKVIKVHRRELFPDAKAAARALKDFPNALVDLINIPPRFDVEWTCPNCSAQWAAKNVSNDRRRDITKEERVHCPFCRQPSSSAALMRHFKKMVLKE